MWAAFALTFIRQLKRQLDSFERLAANVKLLWMRLDWKRGWLELLKIAASWIVFVVLTIYGLTHIELIASPNIGTVGFGIPWVAALLFGFRESKKVFGDPLSADLSKYLRELKYEEKVAFIDRFQDDFADIVTSYIGAEGKVFIFIDDLDRCEVPKAAELLQAIIGRWSRRELPLRMKKYCPTWLQVVATHIPRRKTRTAWVSNTDTASWRNLCKYRFVFPVLASAR
ncbi:hypothetical protein ACVWYK_005941 [Bradyrhizobium sp. USDA 4470]